MASSLDSKENPVEKNGKDGEESRLREGQTAGWHRLREVRQNERNHRQRDDDREIGDGPLEVVGLLVIAQPTQK